MNGDKQERIQKRAYEIWEREGRHHGDHDQHWHRAVAEIETEDGLAGDQSPTKSASIEQVTGAGPAVGAHSKDTAKPKVRRPSTRKSK
jgi:hypothetical protein